MNINKIILFIPIVGLFYMVLLSQFGNVIEDKKIEKWCYIYHFFILVFPIIIRNLFIIV